MNLATPTAAELGQVLKLSIGAIRPSAINDKMYAPINIDRPSPSILSLAKDIREHGILSPIVTSRDLFILSGHRRYAAARIAGLTIVPVCVLETVHSDAPNFLELLVSFNNQREKSLDEILREQVVKADRSEAYHRLCNHREAKSRIDVQSVDLRGTKERSLISAAKEPFLQAAIQVLHDMRPYLPLSVRQIHYQLLNNAPLTHASKPDSQYKNTLAFYKQLSNLLTRARIEKRIPMEWIADETRGQCLWDGHDAVADFIRREIDGFLRGYYRNRQRSQPNHIEIIGEKNTLSGIVKPIAGEYAIPYTTGRGFCSTPPKADMAKRFFDSGKERLILLSLSDLDPEGEEITHSFARDLRDEHGVRNIRAVKVALTFDQVRLLNLPPSMEAKAGSVNLKKFVARHGRTDVYELESIPPATLQQMLRDAIDSVLDVEAFNHEIEREKDDAQQLEDVRQRVLLALQGEEFAVGGGEDSQVPNE